MNGIAGILRLDNLPVQNKVLERISTALSHRFSSPPYHFTHKNFAALSPNKYDTLRDSRYFICFHGMIHNRKALKDKLRIGASPIDFSDASLIVESYKQWHKGCLEEILGDFVFVLYDTQDSTIFCARDLMGTKPIYYHFSSKFFIFASEIKAILTVPAVPYIRNNLRIGSYLSSDICDNESTFYKHVCRLPPSHYLTISKGALNISKYYSFTPRNLTGQNEQSIKEEFLDIFTNSIKSRISDSQRLGAYLSGGLDSSSVVSLLCHNSFNCCRHLPLHTFSGVFQNIEKCDERKYINPIIDTYNIYPHFIFVDAIDPRDTLLKIRVKEDEPHCYPHYFMSFNLLRLAQQHQISDMLSGHDGDSAISYGTGYFIELILQAQLIKLTKECIHVGTKNNFFSTLASLKYFIKKFLEYRIPSILPFSHKRSTVYHLLQHLNPTFSQQNNLKEYLLSFQSNNPHEGQSELLKHSLAVAHPRQALALEFFERQSSHFDIRQHFPFFDKRVIEFCLGLPSHHKIRNGFSRFILRNALGSILPDIVSTRKHKTNFMPSLLHAYFNQGEKWFIGKLINMPDEIYEFIDKNTVKRYIEKAEGSNFSISPPELFYLFRCFSLAEWLELQNNR
jgi:asparagine synthase (glutamine-hydrolysing)